MNDDMHLHLIVTEHIIGMKRPSFHEGEELRAAILVRVTLEAERGRDWIFQSKKQGAPRVFSLGLGFRFPSAALSAQRQRQTQRALSAKLLLVSWVSWHCVVYTPPI